MASAFCICSLKRLNWGCFVHMFPETAREQLTDRDGGRSFFSVFSGGVRSSVSQEVVSNARSDA